MYFYGENQVLVNKYLKNIISKKELDGTEIIQAIYDNINANYNKKEITYENLVNLLWDDNINSIEEVFEGDKYKALEMLFGEDAGTFKEIWNSITKYTYSIGYYRRSYRTKISSKLYLRKNIDKLEEFIYLKALGFSLDKYFENNKENYQGVSVISDILAVKIDNVLDKIKEIIYSDNNTAIVTREIIKGLLMSEKKEAHILVGELLLAAKLQEGLRQAITESLDEGSKEGFLYILKVIIDNKLTRFSSVVRAFDVWTGLSLEVEKPKVIEKCFNAAYSCLTDETYKNSCLESDDNLLIYIGIWSVAFDEVEDVNQVLNKLLSGEVVYKKLVALQFLNQTQFNGFRHKIGCEMLEDSDLEVVTLAIKNIFSDLSTYSLNNNKSGFEVYKNLGGNYYGVELFNKLKRIVDKMPKKEIIFNESVFSWVNLKLTKAEVMEKMMLSIGVNPESEFLDILIDYKDKMSVYGREVLTRIFLKKPKNIKQKIALIESCGDRGQGVREAAFKVVNTLSLTVEDYIYVENLLKFKSGDLRKSAIKLLLKQNSKELLSTIKKLVDSKDENKKLAAVDIVNAIDGDKNHEEIFNESLEVISSMSDMMQKGKILTKNISKDEKDIKHFKNGFRLYEPSKIFVPEKIRKNNRFNIKSKLNSTSCEVINILTEFGELIYENRDLEYETVNWDDSKIMITLGGSNYLRPFNRENIGLDNYPIADKVREFAKKNKLDWWKVIELNFYIRVIGGMEYRTYLDWYRELLEESFNYKEIRDVRKKLKNVKYYNIVESYINLLGQEIPKKERFKIGKCISEYLYTIIPEDNHSKKYLKGNGYSYYGDKDYIASSCEVNYWLELLARGEEDDESFKKYFNIAYNYYKASGYYINSTLTLNDFGRALELEIIDENEMYKELLERPNSENNIQNITSRYSYNNRNELLKYKKLMELSKKAINTIAEIEVNRGELDTEVTVLASKVYRCEGVNIFASIILASEKDTYIRGYNFVSGNCTKKQILSHLLKNCYPKEGESAKTLKEFLKNKKVTDKQLIEAAMYAPQWLDIVSDYIGYKGLKSACWYFHAHVNDYFSEEKSSIIARYTPISSQDLKDGAFDQGWFKEAYKTLGEEKFKLVYDSAKYIAGGSLHKRAQLFVDATLGKLDIDEVKNRVMDKRNKDYLLTYGLIPVKKKKDVLERYEYIQEFIKESKKFGAQRQASEVRSAGIALLNLARNAGFSDVNRLTWNMETMKIKAVLKYLKPKKIEDVEVQLAIDELGKAEVICNKNGKALKSIPAKLKKHEYILEVNSLKKSLKAQHSRARLSFEKAMEDEEIFKGDELINLCKNPVLLPIIKNLVFKSGEFFGYIDGENLISSKNEVKKLNKKDDVIIAHPIHFYNAGLWKDYQKNIFEKQIIQPFKQVFRELYMTNADEKKEGVLSRRYSGYQIQPKKTLALLKTRGWIASHEEGLQKIYYKENIVATIYAMADWFSPTDIESPSIEYIRFEDRKTYKPVKLDEISKLIFSEVMRDLDLVVSVAHVGGVDPEASLSTIEIRTAIVEEILKLMKLRNVKLKGSHAYIDGVHGEYTVHLGSGVTHKMGTGAINIIAVHSGHRGKIFLPFIDSDPKSAEIVSKILLLAEDKKIKDPSILEQI
ncbi:DUF5724 domain-containing protein [Clostridium sp. SHJSY1]|uniref:DUF5724 domain-containing protein n=1 Tax=Clostridium sp. SHJSY1 TaxID=2942483 RepID=UPI0028763D42|nr:DUF5724 domain-containing protein [Clostridium sp. SHJSY1]MDS0525125.1 DUF5724 domain-containing protein [Clostridium sp. SHJSY1]